MPLDSLFISGLAGELNDALAGARIDKIYQPARDRIVLAVRAKQGAARLLVSAGSDARVHFTDMRDENPDTPPGFCVQLRRHIGGGRITAAVQPGRERIIELKIISGDELGDLSEKTLICEMTGRMTNIILKNSENIIISCLKTVTGEGRRAVMPGLKYRLPPAQESPSVYDLGENDLLNICKNAPPGAHFEHICSNISGIPPLFVREILAKSSDLGEVARHLNEIKTTPPRPFMVLENGAKIDFSAIKIENLPPKICENYVGFCEILDDFYRERTEKTALKNLTSSMQKSMTAAKNRLVRKIAGQKQEYLTARERETLKNRADLITANLHAIPPGASSVSVTDFFSEGLEKTEISLDPTLSPQQNAQKLYKRYARLKNAEQALAEQIEIGEQTLEYVESVLYSLSAAATAAEVEQIRQELLSEGYIKDKSKQKRKPKPAAFAPRTFDLGGGLTALCGRNNTENDQLSLKYAQKSDVWLHARNLPGAHVIIRADGRDVTDEMIEKAAKIAAYYSTAANAPRVAVDYCLAKYVKKIHRAGPGMVTYSNFKTANVPPEIPNNEEGATP